MKYYLLQNIFSFLLVFSSNGYAFPEATSGFSNPLPYTFSNNGGYSFLQQGSYTGGSVYHPAEEMTTAGEYWVGACIDSVDGESNTENNCSAGVKVTVNDPLKPDLAAFTSGISSSIITTGEKVTLYVTVKNEGTIGSVDTGLRYFVSTDSNITTDDEEKSYRQFLALPASDSRERQNSITMTTAGEYWVGACIDSVDGESNTENNCSAGIKVTVSNPLSTGDNYEPDNSYSTAKILATNIDQVHDLASNNDEDWVKFTLAEPSSLQLRTSGFTDHSTQIWLYDEALNQINYDDNSGKGNYSLINYDCSTPLASGMYYLKVNNTNQNTTIPEYELSLRKTDGCDVIKIIPIIFELL